MAIQYKKYYDSKQIKNVKVDELLNLTTRPAESPIDPDDYDILTRNKATGDVQRLAASISIVELDPVANAKTITLNEGVGITITGTPSQTLGSNPTWTIASTITQYTDSAARLSISALAPILYNNISGVISHDVSGVTVGTYNNVTVNAYGHVTNGSNVAYLTSFTEADPIALAKTITLNQGGGISITGTAAQTLNSNPSWTVSHSDTSSVTNLDTSVAEVIDTLTFDTYGHVQTVTTRTLTLSDLGYTPVSDTNFATNDLVATGNRWHQWAGNSYLVTGGTTYTINTTGAILHQNDAFGLRATSQLSSGTVVLSASIIAGGTNSNVQLNTNQIKGTVSSTGYTATDTIGTTSVTSEVIHQVTATDRYFGRTSTGAEMVSMTAYRIPDTSVFDPPIFIHTIDVEYNKITANTQGSGELQLYLTLLPTATTANVLYYNTSTSKVTYGAAPSGGGGTLITADNGLTANTSTNVRLGGTLVANTTINTAGFSTTFTGSNPTNNILNLNNTNAGGVYALAATSASSSNSVAAFINTSFGSGITSTAQGEGYAIISSVSGANTNAVVGNLKIDRTTTGTAAAGFGSSIDYVLKTATSSGISNTIISKWTDATHATRTSQFIITGINSAVTSDLFTLSGSGATRLNKYGVGTFTGTPTYNLQVDASGNIIEGSLSGGLTSITADNGLTANTSSNVQLGGTLLQNTTINGGGFKLLITGSVADNLFTSTNTDVTNGVGIRGSGAKGVLGVTTTSGGYGLEGSASAVSAIGVYAHSTTGLGGRLEVTPSSTNTTVAIAQFARQSSSTAANNIGGSLDLLTQADDGSAYTSNQLISKWTTAALATRTSQFSITGVNSTATQTLMSIDGNGAAIFYGAGLPTYTATAITVSSYAFYGHSTGNGVGVLGLSDGNGGVGVYGESDGANSEGVRGLSSAGTAVSGQSTSGLAGRFTMFDSSGNTVLEAVRIYRSTSATPAAGLGMSVNFVLTTSDGTTSTVGNKLISEWTTATTGAATSKFTITGISAGAAKNLIVLKGSGVVNIATATTNYADNTAALAGGLVAGDLYRIGDFLAIVH